MVLPGVPDAPNLPQNGQSFLLSVCQPAQNSEQKKIKDAQKHFGSVLGYESKSKKFLS